MHPGDGDVDGAVVEGDVIGVEGEGADETTGEGDVPKTVGDGAFEGVVEGALDGDADGQGLGETLGCPEGDAEGVGVGVGVGVGICPPRSWKRSCNSCNKS